MKRVKKSNVMAIAGIRKKRTTLPASVSGNES